jgi:7,8-dihydro-6-hydroxymethylpterin-pyrophosphokinase
MKIVTSLPAWELLERTRAIEARMGRVRSFRNGPRLIDIDLLDVRGQSLQTKTLTLPHPRMRERRFVLEPLAEIAPRWRHPGLGKTARQLIRELEDPAEGRATSRPRGRGARPPEPSSPR